MAYELEGQLLEVCTCDVLCPCWIGEDPDGDGTYDAIVAYHIERGSVDGLDVSGHTFAILNHIPGNVLAGNWKVAIFVDDAASQEQMNALVNVWSGKLGGPVADLAGLVDLLGARRDDVAAAAHAIERSRDRDGLRGEPDRFALVRVGGIALGVSVEECERGDGRAQRAHRMGIARRETEQLDDARIDGCGLAQASSQRRQLVPVGELAVPEEVADFFEGGVLGEVLDFVPSVHEPPLLAEDLAEPGLRRDDSLQPSRGHALAPPTKKAVELLLRVAAPRCDKGADTPARKRRTPAPLGRAGIAAARI